MAEIIANDFSAFDTSISDFSAAYKALVNDFNLAEPEQPLCTSHTSVILK